MATHGEIRWPSMGTFDGRLRGDSHGRRQPTFATICDRFRRPVWRFGLAYPANCQLKIAVIMFFT